MSISGPAAFILQRMCVIVELHSHMRTVSTNVGGKTTGRIFSTFAGGWLFRARQDQPSRSGQTKGTDASCAANLKQPC
ncbi:unnamed protein product [Clonostachys rosea f. rosea IK726]|uniref:Uncharacterized protein n=1 Tax=Clonostachys rosea f. rosea IK726 TaxID=1349383 RepID=A0ACA9T7S1_BIOOC|nr:unnamed protein product [Clonostachys rosea f. rosea IK726]